MITPDQLKWIRQFTGIDVDAEPDGSVANLGPPLNDGPVPGEAGNGATSDPVPAGSDPDGHADLPHPMLPDCQIVRGLVPAPDNFVLCAMHGHILDTDTKQIGRRARCGEGGSGGMTDRGTAISSAAVTTGLLYHIPNRL